jgi:AhpD family alkylhydroperoxidase
MIRYVEYVSPAAAGGSVAEMYAQIRRDFGAVPDPFLLHSGSPRLLGGVWAACRETLVAGRAPRHSTELVATVVSQINACPYCVDAHTTMLRADGRGELARSLLTGAGGERVDDESRRLVAWAGATRSPGAAQLAELPFAGELAPELIGTAVAFHYINRMVTVLASPSPFPGPTTLRPLTARIAPRLFARAVRRAKRAGESLRFVEAAQLPGDMSWAKGSPPVAGAFAGLVAAIEDEARDALGAGARAVIEARVGAWQGEDPGLGHGWVQSALGEIAEPEAAAARLGLLAALAPHQIDAAAVAAYRRTEPSDRRLLALLAWSSAKAARRVGEWCAPAGA